MSAVVTQNIQLDFGNPPTVLVHSPAGKSHYASTNAVPIEWECDGPNGLSANPISLHYSTNGEDFTVIVENLPYTNASAGSYSWTLPAALDGVLFRIRVSCASVAGVVANRLSQPVNGGDWMVLMGDQRYDQRDVNASVADMTHVGMTSPYRTAATDAQGNYYFSKDHAVMKVDGATGTVSYYLGRPTAATCAAIPDGAVSSSLTAHFPAILGTSPDRRYLFVYLWACQRTYRIDTVGNTIERWNSSHLGLGSDNVHGAKWAWGNNGWMIHLGAASDIYKTNMNIKDSVPVRIYGDGTGCVNSPGAMTLGAVANTHKRLGTSANCPGYYQGLSASADLSHVWTQGYDHVSTHYLPVRLELVDPADPAAYTIASQSDNGMFMNCSWSWADSTKTFCSGRLYDPATRGLGSELSGYPAGQPTNNGFVSLTPSGLLIERIPLDDTLSSWEQMTVGGSDYANLGNGTLDVPVAFQKPKTLEYSPVTRQLWVYNDGAAARVLNFPALESDPLSVGTATSNDWGHSAGGGEAGGSPWIATLTYPNLSRSGTRAFNYTGWCNSRWFPVLVDAANLVHNLWYGFSGPVCTSPDVYNTALYTYPVASGTSVSSWSFSDRAYGAYPLQRRVVMPNAELYTGAYEFTTSKHVIIYRYHSGNGTWSRVAGRSGVGGYDSNDEGQAAMNTVTDEGAQLTKVHHMQEDANGDLLVLDGTRLRKITITTESALPKIYTLINYEAEFPGFAARLGGGHMVDFHYDEVTGVSYYILPGGTEIRRAEVGVGDSAYDLTGSGLSGIPRMRITPRGLIVLDPAKRRLLKLDL